MHLQPGTRTQLHLEDSVSDFFQTRAKARTLPSIAAFDIGMNDGVYCGIVFVSVACAALNVQQ